MICSRITLAILIWGLSFLLAAPHAANQAESTAKYGKRFALVIGNKDYKRGPLENPANDAFAMDAVLKQLGFVVTVRYNLNRADMNRELAILAEKSKGAEAALVYFSGHGVQHVGKNYLLPVDVILSEARSIPETTVSVDRALETIRAAGAHANIFILDACRDTPFEIGRTRGVVSGLGEVEPGRGTLIAFSTAPGEVAGDGKAGQNSVFTDALIKSLTQENRPAESVFKRVREMVAASTNRKQIPWLNSGITGEFIFNKGTTIKLPKLPETVNLFSLREKSREIAPGNEPQQSVRWTQKLTPMEWAKLDNEIEERAKGVAQDDLSELTGRAYDGEVKAQVILGDAYLAGIRSGTGWIRSNKDAMQWYQRAAARGYPLAQVRIGEMYLESRGTDRDLVAARQWLERAAAQGLLRAESRLRQLQRGTFEAMQKADPDKGTRPLLRESGKADDFEPQKEIVALTGRFGRDGLVEAFRSGDSRAVALYAETPVKMSSANLTLMADSARKNPKIRQSIRDGNLIESPKDACDNNALWAKVEIQDAELFADICGKAAMVAALQRIINEDGKNIHISVEANKASPSKIQRCVEDRQRISTEEYLQIASQIGSAVLFRSLTPTELIATRLSEASGSKAGAHSGTRALLERLVRESCDAELGLRPIEASQLAQKARRLLSAVNSSAAVSP